MKYIKILIIISNIIFLNGCGLAQQTESFQLENLKSDIRVGSSLSGKGLGATGPIELIKVDTGDFTYAIKKDGKISGEKTKLGAISFEVGIKKIADDKYDNILILSFSFPSENNGPVKSARSKFQFTTSLNQISELKAKTKENPQDINKMAEMWANAVEEQGKKEKYEYQYLFNTSLKKGLVTMGERLLNTFPDSVEILINKYPQVVADIEKQGGYDAVTKKTVTAEGNLNKGLQYLKAGNMDEALSSFDKAIKVDPGLERAYANRGNIYLQKTQLNEAIEDFNKAIQLAPNDGPVYGLRAIAYYFVKEYDKSWDDVKKGRILRATFNPGFIAELEKVSGRKE